VDPELGRGKNPPQVRENEVYSFFRSVRFLSRKAFILMAPRQQPQIDKLCSLQREVLRDVFSSADLRDHHTCARLGVSFARDESMSAYILLYRYEAAFIPASYVFSKFLLYWRVWTSEVYRLLQWELIRALAVGAEVYRSGAKLTFDSSVPRPSWGNTLAVVSTFAVLTQQYLNTTRQYHPQRFSRRWNRVKSSEFSER
jgi:hypothetical protein